MNLLPGTKCSRIGLDLGSREFKAFQTSASGRKTSLHAAAVVERRVRETLDFQDLTRLRLAMERQNFSGRQVVVACDPKVVHTDLLDVPARDSGAPVDKIAQIEMQRSSKFEGDFETAFWELPSTARASAVTPVMAVAARHSDIQALVDKLTCAGLGVASVETHATALARVFASDAPGVITAVLDIGASATGFMLVRAGMLIYQRRLTEISLDVLNRGFASELGVRDAEQRYLLHEIGVDDEKGTPDHLARGRRVRALVAQYADALADEMTTSLSYSTHRYPSLRVARAVLTGGGASISGIDRYLGKRLSIPVQVARPADVLRFSPAQADHALAPTLMTAMGLAMNDSE